MQFSEIIAAQKPLESLVRLALATKGATVTDGTVDRYTSLLEAAILADEGESLDGNIWQDFVSGIDGGSKYEGCIRSIAETLGASSSEVGQFLAVSNATIDALTGTSVDEAEQNLNEDLDAIAPTEAEPYSHLDDESRIVSMEVDRAIGAPDPTRPETSHIASEEAEADDAE
ncbi:MAG: hypothetical protein V7788_08530 [Alphaproteobacteria bacterium]|jgi:hypothetical protein